MYLHVKSISLFKQGLGHAMTATAKVYNKLSASLAIAKKKELLRIDQRCTRAIENEDFKMRVASEMLIITAQQCEAKAIQAEEKAAIQKSKTLNLG